MRLVLLFGRRFRFQGALLTPEKGMFPTNPGAKQHHANGLMDTYTLLASAPPMSSHGITPYTLTNYRALAVPVYFLLANYSKIIHIYSLVTTTSSPLITSYNVRRKKRRQQFVCGFKLNRSPPGWRCILAVAKLLVHFPGSLSGWNV